MELLMKRKTIKWIGLSIFLVTCLAFIAIIVYARYIVNPQEFWQQTVHGSLTKENIQKTSELYRELANKTHHGPKPCLRYQQDKDFSPQKLEQVVDDILALGLEDDFSDWIGLFMQWNDDEEKKYHQKSEAEEAYDLFVEEFGFFDRLVAFIMHDRLIEQGQQIKSNAYSNLKNRYQDKYNTKLSAQQKADLKTLWQKHRTALTPLDYIRFFDLLRIKLTNKRLDKITVVVEKWVAEKGSYPTSLHEIELNLKDGWHSDFRFEQTADGLRIASLGADLQIGGQGIEADLVRELEFPKTARDQAVCKSPKEKVVINRKKFNLLLSDINTAAKDARIIPALVEGTAIGFRLNNIRKDSIYDQAGLKDGDIVLALQGKLIIAPDQALEAFQLLKKTWHKGVDLEIQRCNTPYRITLNFD
jgi:hypothetical protein